VKIMLIFYFSSVSSLQTCIFQQQNLFSWMLSSLRMWNLTNGDQHLKKATFSETQPSQFPELWGDRGVAAIRSTLITCGHVTRSSHIKPNIAFKQSVTLLHWQGWSFAFFPSNYFEPLTCGGGDPATATAFGFGFFHLGDGSSE